MSDWRRRLAGRREAMSGNAYKALGFVVWRGGMWYLRRRYGLAKRVGAGRAGGGRGAPPPRALAARRRNGHAHS